MPLGDTFRIRWLKVSAMKILPEPSTATAPPPLLKAETCKEAEVAGPPSPEKPIGSVACDGRDDAVGRHLPDSLVVGVRDEKIPGTIHGDAGGVDRDLVDLSAAEVAGPPSPEKPWVPLPATVVMIPLGDTFRIRLLMVSAMKRFPEASTATPLGKLNDAEVAGPPSPEKPDAPRRLRRS